MRFLLWFTGCCFGGGKLLVEAVLFAGAASAISVQLSKTV